MNRKLPFKINHSKPLVPFTWGEPYEEAKNVTGILKARKMLKGMGFEAWTYEEPNADEFSKFKLYIKK
ncbi:MAG: hypothetical protein K2X86_15475 [Cytophagaceae bacterium]|nr:hypothetical protein [Cytophagaceae bacterium]